MTNEFPIFDGHNDTLLNLISKKRGHGRTFFERSELGHIDLPRAREGGFGGGFFAIFVPNKKKKKDKKKKWEFPAPKKGKVSYKFPLPPPIKHRYALRQATSMAALLYKLEGEANGAFKMVRTADQLAACLQDGTIAAILHFEGAEPVDKDLDSLHIFYGAGLRSLGPVWSRPNKFATGVPFNFPDSPDIGPGLTDLGTTLVKECNHLGIMVDLSHLNEKGFWDVAKLSNAPLVATHSNAHALCPSPRNLTDKQLDAIKETDGLVGINFHIGFLREDGNVMKETSYTEIVRHLDYIANRIGIDKVGLGSDFDGASMPHDLPDVSHLPKLLNALRESGYDDEALKKITHQNWVRVLRKTWK